MCGQTCFARACAALAGHNETFCQERCGLLQTLGLNVPQAIQNGIDRFGKGRLRGRGVASAVWGDVTGTNG